MSFCLFAADLHGREDRYDKLIAAIEAWRPRVVLLGGDLLPWEGIGGATAAEGSGFVAGPLSDRLRRLRSSLGGDFPLVLLILGNDDPAWEEGAVADGEEEGLWRYLHNRRLTSGGYTFYGYSCIPPSPFLMKDWERYDVSRFVDVGAVAPEEGYRSVPVDQETILRGTILQDLERLAGPRDLGRAVFLFHAPPYGSALDRAALDGRRVDHAPMDVHVGSIAIRRFIETRQPLITLHGHVHESARLTGAWKQRIGSTFCFGSAHDGPELAVVRFRLAEPQRAERWLL